MKHIGLHPHWHLSEDPARSSSFKNYSITIRDCWYNLHMPIFELKGECGIDTAT
jgi:hypothetical protein